MVDCDARGIEYGEPLVDDPARLEGVHAVGVGRRMFLGAKSTMPTTYVTSIVDITGSATPLLDVLAGRSGKIYGSCWRSGSPAGVIRSRRRPCTIPRVRDRPANGTPCSAAGSGCLPLTTLGFAALERVRVASRHRPPRTTWARPVCCLQRAHQLREVYQAMTPRGGRRRLAVVQTAALSVPCPRSSGAACCSPGGSSGLVLLHRWRQQPARRGDQPQHRDESENDVRISELPQLQAATTARLRTQLADFL